MGGVYCFKHFTVFPLRMAIFAFVFAFVFLCLRLCLCSSRRSTRSTNILGWGGGGGGGGREEDNSISSSTSKARRLVQMSTSLITPSSPGCVFSMRARGQSRSVSILSFTRTSLLAGSCVVLGATLFVLMVEIVATWIARLSKGHVINVVEDSTASIMEESTLT